MTAASADGKALTPKRHSVVHCWVTVHIAEQLSKEAERRGVHPDRLAADLLTVIIGDNVVAAVLDR